jgi:hypothetical protein
MSFFAWATLALAAGAAETDLRQLITPLPPQRKEVSPQAAMANPPPFTSPTAMQAEFVRRFEASPGFGLSRVMRPIFLAPTPALVWNGATYPVAPPELVGLEDEPVVYAPREHGTTGRGLGLGTIGLGTNRVSRSEVRKLFTHRPLTEIETNAVRALREGRDLVVCTNQVIRPEAKVELVPADAPAPLLVFGALRAGKTCAACHQCELGTLLGAFAYRLTPLPKPDAPPAPAVRSNLVALLTAPTGLTDWADLNSLACP